MLDKNFSTLALLFASNVLDGGKDIEKVPEQLKGEVKELVKSLEEDTGKDLANAESNVSEDFKSDLSTAKSPVTTFDTKEVSK